MARGVTSSGDKDYEKFLDVLIHRSKDGILVIDSEGVILFANPEAERMFPTEEGEELVGYQIGMPAIHDDVELRLPRKGQIRTIEMRTSEVVWKGETVYLTMLRDITRRVEVAHKLVRKNRDLLMLSRVNQAMIFAENEQTLLRDVCQIITEVGDYRMVWVGYSQEDERQSVLPVAQCGFEDGYLDTVDVSWGENTRGRGPTGTAIRSRKPAVAKNIGQDSRFAPWRAEALQRGYASSIALPLIGEEGVFGALNIYDEDQDAFDEDEIELLKELAADLSFGIESLRRRQKQKQAERSLRFQAQLLDTVGQAVIATDPEGKITYWNQAAEHLFGWTAEEVHGKSITDVTPAETNREQAEEIMAALAEGEMWSGEFSVRRRDGTTFPAIVTDTPVLDDQGELAGIIGITTDITERIEAEKALRESEEQLRFVTENTVDVIWQMDKRLRFTYLSPSLYDMTGYQPQEWLGTHLWEHTTKKEFLKMGRAAVRMIREYHTLDYVILESEMYNKECELIPVEIVGKPILKAGKLVGLQGSTRDISERIETQRQLEKSEERYRSLFESVPIGLYRTTPDGELTDANQALVNILGYPDRETLLKTNADELYVRDRDEAAWQALIEDQGVVRGFEVQVKRFDGSKIWVQDNTRAIYDQGGNLAAYQGSLEDISQRVEVEKALKLNEARFRALIESAQDMITVVDAEGVVRYNSPALEEVLGYTPQEHQGKNAFEFIHPDDVSKLADYFQKRVQDPGAMGRIEYRMRHKDGSWRVIESVGRNALEDPAVEGVVINSRDVTLRRRAEELIERQVQELSIQHAIASLGVESNDEDMVIEKATGMINEAFSPVNCGVLLLDKKEGLLHQHPSYDIEEKYQALPARLGEGVVGAVAQSGEMLNVADVSQHEGYRAVSPLVQSELCAPLKSGDHILGVINVESNQKDGFSNEDERLLVTIANQLTTVIEKIRHVNESSHRLERLRALHEIDQTITGSLDLKTTMNVLVDRLIRNLEVDAGAILLYQPVMQTLEFVTGSGFHTDLINHSALRIGRGQAGRAALQREVIHIPDLTLETVDFERGALIQQEKFVAYFGVPLIAKGEVVGVLEVFHRAPLEPTPEWVDFLETLAGQAAIAIDRLNLFHGLERSNMELMRAYNEVIEGWARALELRDQETEGHSRRVEQLTLRIARHMGVKDNDLAYIRQGALLHDIGKMGIPDSILQKPGQLTDEEWQVMKRHPEFAYELLSPIEHLKPALDIPYCHHEKWDGSGYPRGLQGEEIPLAARIFAVVDVWDALRSERPYRDAWSDQKALNYIKEQSDKHFDPRVVDIFLGLVSGKDDMV